MLQFRFSRDVILSLLNWTSHRNGLSSRHDCDDEFGRQGQDQRWYACVAEFAVSVVQDVFATLVRCVMSRRAKLVSDACGFRFGWGRSSICVIVEFGSACEWIVQASCFRTCSGDLQEFRRKGNDLRWCARVEKIQVLDREVVCHQVGFNPKSSPRSSRPPQSSLFVEARACRVARFFVLDVCMRGFPSRWLGGIDVCLHFLFHAAHNWKNVHATSVYAQEMKRQQPFVKFVGICHLCEDVCHQVGFGPESWRRSFRPTLCCIMLKVARLPRPASFLFGRVWESVCVLSRSGECVNRRMSSSDCALH